MVITPKCLKVIVEMMCDRGYTGGVKVLFDCEGSSGPLLVFHLGPDTATTKKSPSVCVVPLCDETGPDGKFGIDSIRFIATLNVVVDAEPISHYIVIHGNGGITPVATQMIAEINFQPEQQQQQPPATKKKYIETFALKSLMFNLARLYKYEEVVDYAPADKESLSYMQWDDPQRRYYDWPAGTVVRRWKQRGTLAQDYTYRLVKPYCNLQK